MAFKIFLVYVQGLYQPDYQKMAEMKVSTMLKPGFAFMTISNADQGFGRIKGTIKKIGTNYSAVPVCCFKRENRQLLWETKSKPDGSYEMRNIAKGLECFVIALDPSNQYNAVISDKVVAK